MTTETYYLGPAPAEETCVQVGDPDYEEKAKRECTQYIAAIRMVCGDEPLGAKLKIARQPHEFGYYSEVVVAFDPENEAAREYAAKCDESAPSTWEAAGMEPPTLDRASEVKRGDGWRRA